MAGLRAILTALARVTVRNVRSTGSFQENNFFILGCVLLVQAGWFLRALLGSMLLLPLSTSSTRAIPPVRWELFPLDSREQWLIRAGALLLNPVVVTALVVIAVMRQLKLGLALVAAVLAAQAAAVIYDRFIQARPSMRPLRFVPAFPGAAGRIIQSSLRQLLSVLDFYAAAVISGLALAYRLFAPFPDPDAMMGATVLIVVAALGTCTQCLFGLDGASGVERLRLMPLRGWRILLAKDAAFLLVVAVLTGPLSAITGLASALAALAVGHHLSVLRPTPQQPWRFTSGSLAVMLLQAPLSVAAGAAVYRDSAWWLVPAVCMWAVSTAVYGWIWDEDEPLRG